MDEEVDKRTQLAEMLEELAEHVRGSEKEPDATFVQICWDDGSLTKAKHIDEGFELLRGVGLFQVMSAEMIDEIRGNQVRTH